MIEEQLTDLERRLLMRLVIEAMPPSGENALMRAELTGLVAKLSGTDTVIVARRAYRSRRSLDARV